VRPHIHLGVLLAMAMLVVGLVMAIVRPSFVRDRSRSDHPADEDRSDRKHQNNDASLQFFGD
jgi:hypothetical protein